jgi:hypothetical protein
VAAWIVTTLFDLDDWTARKEAFLTRYGGTAAALRALDQVVHFEYKNNESAQAFSDRFVHVCNAAQILNNDRIAIAIFRLALPPPLQLEMGRVFQDDWPESVEEVLDKLITVATYSNFKGYAVNPKAQEPKRAPVPEATSSNDGRTTDKGTRPPLPSVLQDSPTDSGKMACGICRMTSHSWRTCTVDRGDTRIAAIRQKFKLPPAPTAAGAHLPASTVVLRRVKAVTFQPSSGDSPSDPSET